MNNLNQYNELRGKLFLIALPVNLREIITESIALVKPHSRILISKWAAENRIVSRKESSRPGAWDNSLVPFAVEIMDAFCDDEVEEVTMMASAQVVKTEIIKNIIGYYIHHDPQKLLLVEPTEDVGRAFSIDKLEPMFEVNPHIAEKISSKKGRDSANTKLHKIFVGGSLTIVGSNSPNSLAQRSVKIVLTDDADRTAVSAGEEGDPITLAEERTETFRDIGFKHGRFSTPTVKGKSKIAKLYEKSDQGEIYVPCPYCEKIQTLKFDNLTWDKDSGIFGEKVKFSPHIFGEDLKQVGKIDDHHTETAAYVCEGCGTLIEEMHKPWMLLNYVRISKYPERKKHRGFWVNRLYSPFSSWSDLANKYLNALGNSEDLKVFFNTSLALVWEDEKAEEIDHTGLIDKVEQFNTIESPFIPAEIVLISCGIDTQPDRFELNLIGWAPGKEPFVIYKSEIYGDPDQDDVWNELDNTLDMTFTRTDGVVLPIGIKRTGHVNRLTFIDAAGKNYISVIEHTRKRQHKGVISIMGRSRPGNHVLMNRTMVGPKKLTQLQNINVDAVKDRIFKLLKRTRDRKADDKAPVAHFSARYCDENYFEGLVSEKPVQEFDRKLGLKIAWKKKSKNIRNEPLDIFVYAWAAMESALPNFEMLKESLVKKAAAIKKENEEKKDKLFLPPEESEELEKVKVEKKVKKVVRRENWVTSFKV